MDAAIFFVKEILLQSTLVLFDALVVQFITVFHFSMDMHYEIN